MFKCKFCGNEYRQAIAQCPTCGGRKFEDALMTTGFHMVGYGPMYEVRHVIQLTSRESMYPMSPMSGGTGSYVFKEG